MLSVNSPLGLIQPNCRMYNFGHSHNFLLCNIMISNKNLAVKSLAVICFSYFLENTHFPTLGLFKNPSAHSIHSLQLSFQHSLLTFPSSLCVPVLHLYSRCLAFFFFKLLLGSYSLADSCFLHSFCSSIFLTRVSRVTSDRQGFFR